MTMIHFNGPADCINVSPMIGPDSPNEGGGIAFLIDSFVCVMSKLVK